MSFSERQRNLIIDLGYYSTLAGVAIRCVALDSAIFGGKNKSNLILKN